MRLTVRQDHAWSGLRRFAGLACGLAGITLLAAIYTMATIGESFRVIDGVTLAWMFVGSPILAVSAAHRLGAPGSRRQVAWAALLGSTIIMVVLWVPGVLSGPRLLIGGRMSGTVEQVSASQAGYAEVSPARVWTERAAYGISWEVKNGRSTSSSVYVVPIVPEIPWTGEVSLFICGQRDEVFAADPTSGALAGTLAPAGGLAGSGIRKLHEQDIVVGRAPRCLAASQRSYAAVFAINMVITFLVVVATIIGATWVLVRGALGR